MRLAFLGDSYDIVKRSFLRWLRGCGEWAADPMFTEEVTPEEVAGYSSLLDVPLVTTAVLTPDTDRRCYFGPSRDCYRNLFLDPDTGLSFDRKDKDDCPKYLFGEELARLATAQLHRLLLVYDQAFSRGCGEKKQEEKLQGKLDVLSGVGVHGIAYRSHACFILVGASALAVNEAYATLLKESQLPPSRFLRCRRQG